ncbi:methylmalonate-semialdehyde dehydrogenase [acylating], mitochondrial-like isoform X2 [Impatiens glandulifera]|uniref:methylmalonate-semialdehyde dehydrogenase [acylating], mitochondrial-like isoform X2 n=1 Tax=Impatiens glandulifera TaxID=253017 RepID=UPI001FB10A6C|nr:methylmalonate-semialdehyde dehydrogenase [acylating], mitochondrial-like isoform X2 [Impatiens glandulifera]
MDLEGYNGLPERPQMLPPPPGGFMDREELIQHVGDFALTQGYVVTIKQSKKDKVVVLGCDRGGVYRNRRKPIDETSAEHSRNRKTGSRLTNCPFECVGKKDDDMWVLTIKNGSHNHEPLKDLTEHPSARRFTETEVLSIKEMTEAGLKPRQILKRLRQNNPELLSTPKHVYNVKAKLRQGNVTVRRLKTMKPQTTVSGNTLATTNEPSWRQRYPPRVPNFIGGRFVDSRSSTSIDVINPATQQVISQVPLTTVEEFKAAVFAAKKAFPPWRNTLVSIRQRLIFKLSELIRRDIAKLATTIANEQGKTLKDAYMEVYRGLEHACGIGSLQMGEFSPNISYGVDTYSTREPLGVCAGICPSNFPAMIPLLMFPVAIACGNTFVLKPSENVPGAAIILAELAVEAGLPSGVLNIIHGTNEIMNSIRDEDDIKITSFVGPNMANIYMHVRLANGQHIQPHMRTKNIAIVMPDASMDATLNALVAFGFGAGGSRCFLISIVVFVGGSSKWEDKLVEYAKSLLVNGGSEQDAALGPVSSKNAKEHTFRLIQNAIDSGAKLALDGRNVMVTKYSMGNFLGPTILSDIRTDMACYKEEILGPVLLCMEADSLEEAINVVNKDKYANGASIFTSSGAAARKFQSETDIEQVGINVPLPAPLPFVSFSGSKTSSGDLNFHGKAGVQFYTRVRTVTQQWKDAGYFFDSYPPPMPMPMPMPISDGSEQNHHESLMVPTTSDDLPMQQASF